MRPRAQIEKDAGGDERVMTIGKIQKIVEKHMSGLSMSALRFVELEILFRLCERLQIDKNAGSFYTLLSKGDVIYEKYFTSDNYLLSNAKGLLKTLGHAKVYHDALTEYQMASNKEYCFYTVEEGVLARNSPQPLIYEDRIKDYDQLLEEGEKRKVSKKEETNSRECFFASVRPAERARISFVSLDVPKEQRDPRTKKGGRITVPIERILNAAGRIDQTEGGSYRRRILENHIYRTSEGNKEQISDFQIDGVVNMAGQVASGKSTFADALSAELIDQGYRVVMILPTVDLVLKKGAMFRRLGCQVCTLIGSSGRGIHIDGQLRGRDYLEEYSSQMLQQPCLLNALIEDPSTTIKYGEEPCTSLRKEGGDPKKTYICQYYDHCPRTRQDREIETADIVVTTLEGFCLCSFGKNRTNFMQYAVKNFDLVIMDEVDNALCRLDSIFAPTLAVNEYLLRSLEYQMEFKRGSLEEKLLRETDERQFIHRLSDLEFMMLRISMTVNQGQTGWSKADLKNFSAMSLLNKMNPKEKDNKEVPQELWDSLYSLLRPASRYERNGQKAELMNLAENDQDSPAEIMNRLLELADERDRGRLQKEYERISGRIWKKIQFILQVITFEQEYRDLSELADRIENCPTELREILNRNLRTQQKLLPNAPIGNTLAIEVRDQEMYIKKQFALGRALALRMPYLVLDPQGKPLGANVLLMSGTGYMPGSDRFHVRDQVDYLIEAEKEKRDYISKTKVIDCRSNICVSGAKLKEKDNKLRVLIESVGTYINKCVSEGERILMIVNSYDQCRTAYNAVETLLNKQGTSYEVSFLQSDSDQAHVNWHGAAVRRRDIVGFRKGILIAPACVIERGYNIVDPLGNAWFDTVMFLVRPMTDPNDYDIHVQRVNGYIMNQYSDRSGVDRIEVMTDMRRKAFERYAKLAASRGSLSDLPEDMRVDVAASLFVVIEQVFGRLCRLGEQVKDKFPTIYWVDGAFHGTEKGTFDTLEELRKYLDYLIHESVNPAVADTLYAPLYKALCQGEQSGEYRRSEWTAEEEEEETYE